MYLMAGINQRTNRVKSKDDVVAVRGGRREKKDVYGFVCLWLVDREFTLLLPDRRIIFNDRRRIGEFNS